ncbi:MAG: hypothetical protein QOK48_2506, partial [Blastocatellia bacterium]|nr:hypothetical protein [Blastocatellia bacterium]
MRGQDFQSSHSLSLRRLFDQLFEALKPRLFSLRAYDPP